MLRVLFLAGLMIVVPNASVAQILSGSGLDLPPGQLPKIGPPFELDGCVIAVSAGEGHSAALLDDGTVITWGWNQHGQLGDGTNVDAVFPVSVVGPGGSGLLTDVIAIAAAELNCAALRDDGTVWTWGYNDRSQLGIGYPEPSTSVPVQVMDASMAPLDGVKAIAAGGRHFLALKHDGTVWGWGDNLSFQVDDTLVLGLVPHATQLEDATDPTSMLTQVKAIEAGDFHSLALKSDGTVRAWGNNEAGQLGNGAFDLGGPEPNPVSGIDTAVAIAAGYFHSMALLSDGTVRAWGFGFYGNLGDGDTVERNLPVTVSGLSGVTAIDAGQRHSLALLGDGTLRAWGDDSDGQLGNGADGSSSVPVMVSTAPGVKGIAGEMGRFHSLALRADGTVLAWGSNHFGQLGNGTTVDGELPRPVVAVCDCAPPPTNMLGWWPFDDVTGAVTADLAGHDNSGGLIGPPSSVPVGVVGPALSFDGTGQHVSVPDHHEIDLHTCDLTIDAWVRTTRSTGIVPIVDKRDFTPVGYTLFLANGRLGFQLADGAGPSPFCGTSPMSSCTNFHAPGGSPNVADGQWHHVAVTVDRSSSSGGELWVDGKVVHEFDPTVRQGSLNNDADLWIGRHHPNAAPVITQDWLGEIDEVELFQRSLSDLEIKAIFVAGSKGKCKDGSVPGPGLVICPIQ